MVAPRSAFDFQAVLRSLPKKCGVYRMLDEEETVLYVGKARDLKARVSSYFHAKGLANKTQALIRRTSDIQVTITESETEALLLEQSFIKREKPPYNVVLRDGKSYPYIRFSNHVYPRISLYRGTRGDGAQYFGPYPSTRAVRESIAILQRLFRLRPCEDTFFKSRSRPCLQHQIDRCSAPCVTLIDTDSYNKDVLSATKFLGGKSTELLGEFKTDMNSAAEALEFERAAVLRDQITQLVKVQEQQNVYKAAGSVDVFGIANDSKYACVQAMFIRDGRLLGHRTWYPNDSLGRQPDELLSAFVSQFYIANLHRDVPKEILTSVPLPDAHALRSALSTRLERKVELTTKGRTHRAQWLAMVQENAEIALQAFAAKKINVFQRFMDLQEKLELEEIPSRLACFDISHARGEATVASCVIFDHDGPCKPDYRKFNIRDVKLGDDYAALAQATTRYFKRMQSGEVATPDVLVIDGGRGQVASVAKALSDLQVTNTALIGISKGEGRKAELDTIWTHERGQADVPAHSGAMYLLQHLRDEAHRFAISGHRSRRQKQRRRSALDDIPGIGPRRKRDLLTHFGSVATIKGASEEELTKVPGISRKLAEEIYGIFHAI